jgi:hypothetical protein
VTDPLPCACGGGKPMINHDADTRRSWCQCETCYAPGASWHWPTPELDYERACTEARLLWNIGVDDDGRQHATLGQVCDEIRRDMGAR